MSAETQDEREAGRTAQHPNAPDAGWPSGMPYTVHFPYDGDYLGADLEHPAPLPRAGDVVEYIDERGACRRYRVKEVIHTLQTSAAQRPRVEEGTASPQSVPRLDPDAEPEPPGGSGVVRAGLPKVILEELPDEE